MEEMIMNGDKQGGKQDMEMRRYMLERVEELHAYGKQRILSEEKPAYSIDIAEVKVTREKLKELRDLLHNTLMGFVAGHTAAEGDEAIQIAACINIYPAEQPAE